MHYSVESLRRVNRRGLSFQHHLHSFVVHAPRRVVGNAQFAVRQAATFVVSATGALQAVWSAPMEKPIEALMFSAVCLRNSVRLMPFGIELCFFSWIT